MAGLAAAVERGGATIYEATPVSRIESHRACTVFGDVTARYVLRATEGFTARLPGQRRAMLPMNSSMIVTEPLGDDVWRQIGWSGCETLGDEAHVYMYAQRTADGRIAIGGRGVPYRFGSGIDDRGATQPETTQALLETLRTLLPQVGAARVEHAWCGVLGVPRDWCAAVSLDSATGLGSAGGYTGHGVAAANLAGRHARRPRAGPGYAADRAALGRPPGPPVGAGSPLARRPRPVLLLPARRPAGERRVVPDVPASAGRRCHRRAAVTSAGISRGELSIPGLPGS